MEPPARTARRLFFGLGFAMLLATAFALIDGRLPPAECPDDPLVECTSSSQEGWLVPATALLCLAFGGMLHMSIEKGIDTPASTLFTHQTTAELRHDLQSEASQSQDEEQLSSAWADLEKGLLEAKSGEEE